MGFFDFLKRKRKSSLKTDEIKEPSAEQILFAETVLEIIGPSVEDFGFKQHSKEIKECSARIVYRKGAQYIKINSTNFPTDYPYYYVIVLGEGSSEKFSEYDWNSVALWKLAKTIDPTATIGSYSFPYDEKVKSSIQRANGDLLKYGISFLRGDLSYFNECRKETNRNRETYKIHSPGKDGKFITTDEPKSAEQKKKYS